MRCYSVVMLTQTVADHHHSYINNHLVRWLWYCISSRNRMTFCCIISRCSPVPTETKLSAGIMLTVLVAALCCGFNAGRFLSFYPLSPVNRTKLTIANEASLTILAIFIKWIMNWHNRIGKNYKTVIIFSRPYCTSLFGRRHWLIDSHTSSRGDHIVPCKTNPILDEWRDNYIECECYYCNIDPQNHTSSNIHHKNMAGLDIKL